MGEKIIKKYIKISKLHHVNEDIVRKVQQQKINLVNYDKKRESSINIPNNNKQDEKLIASLHEENKLLIHEMEHLKKNCKTDRKQNKYQKRWQDLSL